SYRATTAATRRLGSATVFTRIAIAIVRTTRTTGDRMTTFDLPSPARYLLAAELKPLQGQKFQPTGFPDVGAGVFKTPANQEFLAVESHQSVANRLESAIWDDVTQDLIAPAKGLSYVKVVDEGNAFLTASVLEAHRL